MNSFGERFKKMRVSLKLKQLELAKILVTSSGAISEIEADKRNPSFEALSSLYGYMENNNISFDWLLTGEGEMYKQNTDIQPEFYIKEKLNVDEEFLLNNYKKLDKNSKVEFLNLVVLKTLEVPKGKSYNSTNASDEIVAGYELWRLAS